MPHKSLDKLVDALLNDLTTRFTLEEQHRLIEKAITNSERRRMRKMYPRTGNVRRGKMRTTKEV